MSKDEIMAAVESKEVGLSLSAEKIADMLIALVKDDDAKVFYDGRMAHFSFPYYFTIPNSEFRIPNSEICTTNFGIRNCEVYVICASGNR